MCLAIYAPAGSNIPEKNLRNGFENHSDGAGIAWAEGGKLHAKKGMFKVEEVIELYEKVKQYHCLIHFRKATHGRVDAANCHPFLFDNGKYALIHNGIISIKCNINGLSDTAHFVKLVLEPLVATYGIPINDGSLHYLISTSIGSDKMCIMDGEGKCYVFNEEGGTWEEGVWYSNLTFRWSYKKANNFATRIVYDENGIPQYGGIAPAVGSINNSGYKHTHWRRHWHDPSSDKEDDESYLEFWRRNATGGVVGVEDLTKKSEQPLLLGNGVANKSNDGNSNNVAIEEERTSKEAANSPDDSSNGAGTMREYGWFDVEVENQIARYQKALGLSREESLLRVFNEK